MVGKRNQASSFADFRPKQVRTAERKKQEITIITKQLTKKNIAHVIKSGKEHTHYAFKEFLILCNLHAYFVGLFFMIETDEAKTKAKKEEKQ